MDQESKQAYNRVLHGLKQKVTAELRMVVKKAAAGSPLLGNPQIQDSYTSLTTSKVWRQSGCCAWGTPSYLVTVRPVLIGPGPAAVV